MTDMIAIKKGRLREVRRRQAKIEASYTKVRPARKYSTYRNGRLYAPYTRADRNRQQLKEAVLVVAALAILVICAGIAGGVTGL